MDTFYRVCEMNGIQAKIDDTNNTITIEATNDAESERVRVLKIINNLNIALFDDKYEVEYVRG